MNKILVLGASGQLGKDLIPILTNKGMVIPITHSMFDLTNPKDLEKVTSYFEDYTHVINCSAFTNVEACEDEANSQLVLDINHIVPGLLATFCKQTNIRFLHISTDFVFSNQSSPINEKCKPNPINRYGLSKYAGEKYTLITNPKSTIIRTSWLHGTNGKNFAKSIATKLINKEDVKVVDDQIGSPTWTIDLAHMISKWIDKPKAGIFHYSNRGETSWFLFAKYIEQKLISMGYEIGKVFSQKTSETNYKAKRPAYSYLDCSKIEKAYKTNIPHWQISLDLALELMYRK